jgi:outer membrane immunogenic protein
MLVYGTGGLAYGNVSASTSLSQTVTNPPPPTVLLSPTWAGAGAVSDTRVGWTAGGGVEWMFLPGWSAKAEYLHYDLGSLSYGMSPLMTSTLKLLKPAPLTTNTLQSKAGFTGDIVRAGINWHF